MRLAGLARDVRTDVRARLAVAVNNQRVRNGANFALDWTEAGDLIARRIS